MKGMYHIVTYLFHYFTNMVYKGVKVLNVRWRKYVC